MTYQYSSENRLLVSCSYMYTPFEGCALIKRYMSSRLEFIDRLTNIAVPIEENDLFSRQLLTEGLVSAKQIVEAGNNETGKQKLSELCRHNPALLERSAVRADNYQGKLEELAYDEQIETLKLLTVLFSALVNSPTPARTEKFWIDRLVQRFEVTKKLFETYQPGFAKGAGSHEVLLPYVLLAMCLSIFYDRSSNLKYMNALLKVNDTVVSVADRLSEEKTVGFLAVLSVLCEGTFMHNLLKAKGIANETE